jgi:DNA-binding transcriptional MerR regulator/methylmalonyl-CoA mutase cobalamin-binding subunit
MPDFTRAHSLTMVRQIRNLLSVSEKATNSEPRHPIRVVSARTGLPQDVIRVWERRYKCVCPPRGNTGRRLYTDEDVDRLRLLKQAVCAGRRISDVAALETESLRALVSEDSLQAPADTAVDNGKPRALLDEAMDALENLDRYRLHRVLSDASVEMSGPGFRQQLIVPLLSTIGERWKEGSLRIVHEHLASTIIRSFFGAPRNPALAPRAPRIIVTTPAGQYHELGALMACAVAEEIGWDVVYLGAALPAEEIAAAVKQIGAKAVALSLCFRESDSHALDELNRLRNLLGPDIPIFVGGNAARCMRDRLGESGIACPSDLAEFRAGLQATIEA